MYDDNEENENRNINFCSLCGWTGFAQFHACLAIKDETTNTQIKK